MTIHELGAVVAERRLEGVDQDGVRTTVTITVGAPRPDDLSANGDWCCPHRITGLGDEAVEASFGVDSLQALLLSVYGLRVKLAARAEEAGVSLDWLGMADLGLAVVPETTGVTRGWGGGGGGGGGGAPPPPRRRPRDVTPPPLDVDGEQPDRGARAAGCRVLPLPQGVPLGSVEGCSGGPPPTTVRQWWWPFRPRVSTGVAPGRVHCGTGLPVGPQVGFPSASVRQDQHGFPPSGQPSGLSSHDSPRP
jgi:hypothetical protein